MQSVLNSACNTNSFSSQLTIVTYEIKSKIKNVTRYQQPLRTEEKKEQVLGERDRRTRQTDRDRDRERLTTWV